MDMLDDTLESSHDKTNDSAASDEVVHLQGQGDGEPGEEQAVAIASVTTQGTISLDATGQYQFGTTDSAHGPVTYRVVHVGQDGEPTGQVVTTSAFPVGTQVAQVGEVIQSPFSNGSSPTNEGHNDQRFTYYPTTSVANEGAVVAQPADVQAAALGSVQAAGGQFYVMMSPQDVLQGQRSIAPRTTYTPKMEGNRSVRDDRRRATHNEVERRRRDKINNWIVQLSKMVPDCAQEHQNKGQILKSKGGILSKACDYISELRTANARMAESLKETERLSVDAELLRQQCEELKQENTILRVHMQQHGIVLPDMPGGSA